MPRRPGITYLGDETDSDEEFQSPEEEIGQTNYELNFTNSRIDNPYGASTSRNAQTNAKVTKVQPTARKRTGGRNSVNIRSTTLAQNDTARRRKSRKPLHRNQRLWGEIKFLMKTTHTLIPHLPFGRVVREIMISCSSGDMLRITKMAMKALHESTELYITQQLQDAYTLTLHRGRVTLSVKDMELLRFLRGRI